MEQMTLRQAATEFGDVAGIQGPTPADRQRKLYNRLRKAAEKGWLPTSRGPAGYLMVSRTEVQRYLHDPRAARKQTKTRAAVQALVRPLQGLARVIVVSVFKGGCGKTTTATTLAALLAARGERVLYIDADAQGNGTKSVGIRVDKTTATLSSVIGHWLDHGDVDLSVAIRPTMAGFDLVPTSTGLSNLEYRLMTETSGDNVWAILIDGVRDQYHTIIIDTPADTTRYLCRNALAYTDDVIVPCRPASFDADSLDDMLAILHLIQKRSNPHLNILGILLTMVDWRVGVDREFVQEVRNKHGKLVCPTVIPDAKEVREAQGLGKTLIEHAPHSEVTRAYQQFVAAVLPDEEHVEHNSDDVLADNVPVLRNHIATGPIPNEEDQDDADTGYEDGGHEDEDDADLYAADLHGDDILDDGQDNVDAQIEDDDDYGDDDYDDDDLLDEEVTDDGTTIQI